MKGESSLSAKYVLEMALLLGTDGLKINMFTGSKVSVHDTPSTF